MIVIVKIGMSFLMAKLEFMILGLIIAIATDVLSSFYSAEGNGLVNKTDQAIALVLYIISFACAAYALTFMQAGILDGVWLSIGRTATTFLANAFVGQNIDIVG